jgi:hypothetical protein
LNTREVSQQLIEAINYLPIDIAWVKIMLRRI